MKFGEAMREAALKAEEAVERTLQKYRDNLVTDEDDLTAVMIGNLDSEFSNSARVGGISWSSSILRHRSGIAAEEKRIGADMILHVSLATPTQSYSKAVLVQAKRKEPGDNMSKQESISLNEQCNRMLEITPASFVLNYSRSEVRCASSSKISGSTERDLHANCDWTSYRFFLELFRCPIGDPRITSAVAADLPAKNVLSIKGKGELF